MTAKEYITNDFLKLKLVDNKKEHYVKDKYFYMCNALLLNIHSDKIDSYKKIDSIDEVP